MMHKHRVSVKKEARNTVQRRRAAASAETRLEMSNRARVKVLFRVIMNGFSLTSALEDRNKKKTLLWLRAPACLFGDG
jgi:hypothetical protein